VDKVTLLPRGGAGGYTRFMPDEEQLDSGLVTRSSCMADLVVALGGRAAEQVVFGPVGSDPRCQWRFTNGGPTLPRNGHPVWLL
jgi:hypothetical protein